jgi:hypothetical protein
MTTESTAIIPSYLDDVDLPDDLPDMQLEPPRLNWHHGAQAGKITAPGVFFGRDTAFTDPPPPPWEIDERFIDDDGPGYSVAIARFAFVGMRSQWFIPGATRNDPIVWLLDGQRQPDGTKVKKMVEYLVLIDGLADVAVLSVSGYYKSRPIENILRAYERGALAQEIRRRKRRLPGWSHWLTIGGKVDDKGKPILEKAFDAKGDEHGSDVTPPTLLSAPELVDRDTFQQAIDAWNLYNSLGWFKFRRLPRDVTNADYTVHAVPQLPAGRNAPQPITVDAEGAPVL